jgi:hypothetical protein
MTIAKANPVLSLSFANPLDKESADRSAYANALVLRLSRVLQDEMPPGMGKHHDSWAALLPDDQAFVRMLGQYEDGKVARERVDAAAINLLHAWREQAKSYRHTREALA